MNAAVSLIDIERFVLRDPIFTAERAERIRLALHAELERRAPRAVAAADIDSGVVASLAIEVRSSDEDESIARQLADSILGAADLQEGGGDG